MRSLIAQGTTPHNVPESCASRKRTEVTFSFREKGRLYKFVVRDKIIPEDPYLVLVKAAAFAIQQSEPYNGRAPERALKDFLIKNNLVL